MMNIIYPLTNLIICWSLNLNDVQSIGMILPSTGKILFNIVFVQIRRMVGVAVAIAMGKVDLGLVDRFIHTMSCYWTMSVQRQFQPSW